MRERVPAPSCRLGSTLGRTPTHVIFEPLDFIAWLAVLVPKPRVNLTRFHRVFAPNSKSEEAEGGIHQTEGCPRRGELDTARPQRPGEIGFSSNPVSPLGRSLPRSPQSRLESTEDTP